MHPSECHPLPNKVRLQVNCFTYARSVGQNAASWLCAVGPSLKDFERIDNVMISTSEGYPTDRCRNAIAKSAKDQGYEFLLMLDDDMWPDMFLGHDPGAKAFLPTALQFALDHDGPCVVGAPYCGAPPAQEVVVMCQREYCPDAPDNSGLKIDKYSRHEAAAMKGITRVSALPTGCMLIDLRCLDVLPPPWFSYEYADPPFNTKLASTEDIVFSRNLDWLGVPQYCAWDSWAGHVKTYVTGRPLAAPVVDIPGSIYKAWKAGWRPEKDYNGNPIPPEPGAAVAVPEYRPQPGAPVNRIAEHQKNGQPERAKHG